MASRAEYERQIQEGVDLRDQLPGIPFSPTERVVDIRDYSLSKPKRHLSAMKAVMDLTRSTSMKEIGVNGPSNASAVRQEHKDVNALRRYEVFFLRDGHIAAFFLRDQFPQLTEATVMEGLRFTGVRNNLRTPGLKDEQEVGKGPHEIRDPETDARAQKLSQEKEWGWPYYGAVDTTVKNAKAIAFLAVRDESFLERTYEGLDGRSHTVEEGLRGHINWIRKRMELNPEGLIESLWMNPKHHANQTWPDAPNAFQHEDGSWPRHYPERNWGVAALELQAETYDALVDTADLYTSLAEKAKGQEKKYYISETEDLRKRADHLRETVMDAFWVEGQGDKPGYFARGTDRDPDGKLRPMKIRSSDMGHLLTSRILDGSDSETVQKRESVIRNLFSEEMLGLNGIQTYASDSHGYRPTEYHNGCPWPWQNYYIAKGLERHGYFGLAYELKKKIWDVYDQTHILPEYTNGGSNPKERISTKRIVVFDASLEAEPVHSIANPPQEIQAWTAFAVLAMKYEERDRRRNAKDAIPTAALDGDKHALEEELL